MAVSSAEKHVCALIYDVLDLPYRQVVFFCQSIKRDAVNQSSAKNFAVSFGVSTNYLFIDSVLDLGAGHRLTLTLPVP